MIWRFCASFISPVWAPKWLSITLCTSSASRAGDDSGAAAEPGSSAAEEAWASLGPFAACCSKISVEPDASCPTRRARDAAVKGASLLLPDEVEEDDEATALRQAERKEDGEVGAAARKVRVVEDERVTTTEGSPDADPTSCREMSAMADGWMTSAGRERVPGGRSEGGGDEERGEGEDADDVVVVSAPS